MALELQAVVGSRTGQAATVRRERRGERTRAAPVEEGNGAERGVPRSGERDKSGPMPPNTKVKGSELREEVLQYPEYRSAFSPVSHPNLKNI